MQPWSPKDLFRRLDELSARVFASVEGPEAVGLLAGRLVGELGPELGLRAARMQVEEAGDGPRGSDGTAWLRILIDGRGHALAFELEPVASPERVEIFLGTLNSVLAMRLLERSFGSTMRQAAEIQQSLLPQRAPAFDGYDIAVRSTSADEVGGDLYDFLALDEDTLGLAVGDASGHGLPAALLVRDVVVGLRMGMEKDLKPEHALARLNRVIHESTLSSSFVSLFYAELERNGNLFYFNAGHEPPLLFDARGATTLAFGDIVIGPLPSARFKRHYAHIDHGATLVLYSDGLVERRNGERELFGLERLGRTIEGALGSSAEAIAEHVYGEVLAFGGSSSWEDDATLVVVRRLP